MMMLSNEQLVDILRELRVQMNSRKLGWYSEGGAVRLALQNRVEVELAQRPDLTLTVAVKRIPDEVLGRMEIPLTDHPATTEEARFLYEAASKEAGREIFAEIMDTIKFAEGAEAHVMRTLPHLPGRLPQEKAAEVLKKMSGKWDLDYSRGKEKAVIDEKGTYFIEGKKDPAFQLVVLAVNDSTGVVEVAKDLPDGRRRQIEYLTFGSDSLTGHAKHDGHKLRYTRPKM